MPKGPRGEKRPADVIGNAVTVMRIATGEEEETLPERSAAAAKAGIHLGDPHWRRDGFRLSPE